MVILRLIICFILLFVFNAEAFVSVDASIDNGKGYAGEAIQGTLLVTHNEEDEIDPSSFEIEGKPLKVVLTNTKKMSSGQRETVVSIYRFELPARAEGLYVLPSVLVQVKGQTYRSISGSFEIASPTKKKAVEIPARVVTPKKTPIKPLEKSALKNKEVLFHLDSSVEAPKAFYPGQRAKFVYRIYYNHNIDLSESYFPLLEAEGFKKIGDIEVKDYEKDGVSLQELIQEVQAIKPGTYTFGTASISGYMYEEKEGRKVYSTHVLKSDAPSKDVVVLDFPTQDQPGSFTGGMGSKLVGKLQMLTSKDLQIDDSIKLELAVSGPTNLDEMEIPNLDCQPEIAGFFDVNDLSGTSVAKESHRIFSLELRPVSTFVKAVPPIELSIFNPLTQEYIIWRSDPIPLNIADATLPIQTNENRLLPFVETPLFDVKKIIQESNIEMEPIHAFDPILVTSHDLHFKIANSSWILFIIPAGCLFLFWQYRIRDDVMQKRRNRKETNEEILKRVLKGARKDLKDSEKWKHNLGLLKSALYIRLRKSGYMFVDEDAIKNIRNKPLLDETKMFITKLEELQYGVEEVDEGQYLEKREKTFRLMDEILLYPLIQ